MSRGDGYSAMDDLTIQRLRQAGLHAPERAEPAFGATRSFQVYNAGSMPSTTPRVYACRPVELAGTEVEGGTWNSVATAVFVPVVFLGPDAPALGEVHDAVQYGGRHLCRGGFFPASTAQGLREGVFMEHYLAGFAEWVLIIQGAVFVLVVMLFRKGLVGQWQHLLPWSRKSAPQEDA